MPHRTAPSLAALVAASALLLTGCGGTKTVTVLRTVTVTASPSGAPTASDAGSSDTGSGDAGSGDAGSGGAGSPTDGGSASTALAACSALTLTEVSAVAGLAMLPATDTTNPTFCQYESPANGPTRQVEVFIGDGAKQGYDTDRRLKHTFTAVPGVGSETYLESGAAFVRRGKVWAEINAVVLDATDAELAPRLTAAVTAMAGRM